MTIQKYEGGLIAKGLRFGIIAGRFNEFISSRLLDGAVDAIIRHGGDESDIETAWVPGAFEIPLAAQKMANLKRFDAIICVGAVIRGTTPHFDYVAAEVSKGIARITLDAGIPIIFGVLTTDTIEQARKSRRRPAIKGRCCSCAIEMANLLKQF